MSQEEKRGLRIFLQYWLLLALLAGFNLYNYFKRGNKLSLIIGIVGAVIFVGWAAFYKFYVRAKR